MRFATRVYQCHTDSRPTCIAIVQDFLDILMLPARKRLAATQFEETRLRVSNAVFALAGEVRSVYYSIVAAQQTAAVMREVAEVAQASYDLAKKFHEAGNTDDLALANEQALYEQARVEQARSESEVRIGRERLTTLLGLGAGDVEWKVPDTLPEPPQEETVLEHLESAAIAQRLDLAAAGRQVQTLGITRDWRWIAAAEIGLSSERDTDKQIEFTANAPGDWAFHCHKSHHTMNAMGHGIPNPLGVDQSNLEARVMKALPGYMAMGENGMAGHQDMVGAGGMPGPANTLPMMMRTGPFGNLEMGGMFTVVKVRDNLTSYADPGWYKHPPGTVARKVG